MTSATPIKTGIEHAVGAGSRRTASPIRGLLIKEIDMKLKTAIGYAALTWCALIFSTAGQAQVREQRDDRRLWQITESQFSEV